MSRTLFVLAALACALPVSALAGDGTSDPGKSTGVSIVKWLLALVGIS